MSCESHPLTQVHTHTMNGGVVRPAGHVVKTCCVDWLVECATSAIYGKQWERSDQHSCLSKEVTSQCVCNSAILLQESYITLLVLQKEIGRNGHVFLCTEKKKCNPFWDEFFSQKNFDMLHNLFLGHVGLEIVKGSRYPHCKFLYLLYEILRINVQHFG